MRFACWIAICNATDKNLEYVIVTVFCATMIRRKRLDITLYVHSVLLPRDGITSAKVKAAVPIKNKQLPTVL